METVKTLAELALDVASSLIALPELLKTLAEGLNPLSLTLIAIFAVVALVSLICLVMTMKEVRNRRVHTPRKTRKTSPVNPYFTETTSTPGAFYSTITKGR